MYQKEILKIADIVEMLSISKTTVWRWTQENRLPRPIYMGNKVFGWRRKTILEWLDGLEEAA